MKAKISTLIKSPSFIVASVAIILGIIYTFSGLFNPVIKTSGPYGPLAWNSKDYGPATFTQASIYCHDLGDNWRVPTMDELNYAIKGHYIPFVSPNFYWSSTQDEHVDYKYNAYTMNAGWGWTTCSIDNGNHCSGYVGMDNPGAMYVRCVKNQ